MEQVGGACDVKLMRGLDEYLQGESAQRDTTTEKPRVMVAGSTHQADDDAAEKNPQLGRPEFALPSKIRGSLSHASPLLFDNLYGLLCSTANCRST